jgi:hypothetical protein
VPETSEQTKTAPKRKRAAASPPARRGKTAGPETKTRSRAAKTSKPRPQAAKAPKPAATPTSAIGSAGKTQTRPSRQSKRLAQPAQPRGVPKANQADRPEPTTELPVLRTALQAAAELTEIGVTLSGKALRRALRRFPRP